MARPIRVEFEGAIYHVTARGNERRRIFRTDEDRSLFLKTLEQMIERFGIVLQNKKGQEEIRWQRNEGNRERMKRLKDLLAKEEDPRIKIWVRVRLGGERPVDVGREMGYRNGSGVLQVIKRLDEATREDKGIGEKMSLMRRKMSIVES